MKRVALTAVIVCLALAIVVVSGCGKKSEEPQQGAESKAQMDAAKAQGILEENRPILTNKEEAKDRRINAAASIGELGQLGRPAVKDLVAVMGDAKVDPEVAGAAKDALAKVTSPEIADTVAANFKMMAGFKKDVDSYSADYAKCKADLEKANKRAETFDADMGILSEKFAKSEAALQTATDSLKSINEDKAKLTTDLAAANKKVEDLAKENAQIEDLKKQIADLTKKTADSENLQNQVATLTKTNTDLKAENEGLKKQVQQMTDQIAQLNKQIEELKAKIAQLENKPGGTPTPTPTPPSPNPTPGPAPAPPPAAP